jgi:hypothetical protein
MLFSMMVVISTSALIAIDGHQIDIGRTIAGRKGTTPITWGVLGLAFWIIGYPAYLGARSRVGATNFLGIGIFAAFFFLAANFWAAFIQA